MKSEEEKRYVKVSSCGKTGHWVNGTQTFATSSYGFSSNEFASVSNQAARHLTSDRRKKQRITPSTVTVKVRHAEQHVQIGLTKKLIAAHGLEAAAALEESSGLGENRVNANKS